MNQQLYTLDQVKELVKVGFIKIQTDNTIAPTSVLTNEDQIHKIFKSQISEWTGQGMKVKIRSEERCRDCGLIYKEENKFHCENHDRWARRVFVSITGLKDHKDGRERIFSDNNDIPLSIEVAINLKNEIVDSIKDNTFTIKRYLPRSRQTFLFKNYKKEYLMKMEWRTKRLFDDPEWMSLNHLKGIKNAFKNHFNYFDSFEIQNIKKKHIKDYFDSLECNRNCKRRLISYLKHFLRWALSREDLMKVPTMPKIKLQRKKKKGLYQNAQFEILQYIPESDKPIFEFLIETGRRINEARAIRFRDLKEKERIYRIGGAFDMERYKPFPKVEDHAEEEFPITNTLLDILKRAAKDRNYGADDFVFINRIGSHYKDTGLRKIFNRARKKAGYNSITLNCFGRHSKGLQLKMAGASDEDIASILGNTPEIVRQTYTHIEAGGKAKILNLLDKRKGKEESDFGSNLAVGGYPNK